MPILLNTSEVECICWKGVDEVLWSHLILPPNLPVLIQNWSRVLPETNRKLYNHLFKQTKAGQEKNLKPNSADPSQPFNSA
nr:hypothetical protein CFP56_34603 [Quercus suber]